MNTINTPYTIKGLELKNRIVMAPMCQFSVPEGNGVPNDWHYTHYVSRAVGGTGLILVEMTGITPDGRITHQDLGLWNDTQMLEYKRIVEEVHKQGAKIGIQLGHAGRKAQDAIQPVGASDIYEGSENKEVGQTKLNKPKALSTEETREVIEQFKSSAERAVKAGFDTIELHGAHGFLIHQFMSPIFNNRKDAYGSDLSRFGVETIRAVKSVMPRDMPLIMRLSAIEYVDGGYDLQYCLEIAEKFRDAGVDAFHISTGGEGEPGKSKPGNYPGYQVPFARAFKERLGVPVIAVGILEAPKLAEATLSNHDADLVAIGRGMLSDPYWSLHAIKEVTGEVVPPAQYARAFR